MPRILLLVAALAASMACDETPTQPAPLADCTILGVVAPSTLEVGETRRLSAFLEHCRPMYLPLDSDRVVWQSLDPAVASVSGDILTAHARGPAVIQGTFGQMTQQALVIVGGNVPGPGPAVLSRLRIYGCPQMSVGQRGTFGVFAVMSDGTATRVSSSATWGSSDPSVAGISGPTGDAGDRAVDAFSAGTTRMTAAYQGMSSTFAVQVHSN